MAEQRPAEAPVRLLCDEMLHRLGRWLRAAGYDTVVADAGRSDRELMEQAVREGRWLVTRDRGFLERRAAEQYVIYLDTEDPDAQARQLAERLGVDWLHRPFSRCLLCNSPLQQAEPAQRPEHVEGPVQYCPACDQLFWEGHHVQRMRRRLHGWREPR